MTSASKNNFFKVLKGSQLAFVGKIKRVTVHLLQQRQKLFEGTVA
jgi:hypothetical protein